MQKIFSLSFLFLLCTLVAQAQLDLPRPSPHATVMQRVGLTDITVDYSRPSMKGRTIFGDDKALVPNGKLWRTGANNATTIEFSDAVTINGKDVPAGKYAFFTIPGKDEWTLILNKNADQGGTDQYDEKMDQVRLMGKPMAGGNTESMLIYFDNVTDNSADMMLAWADMKVKLPIKASYKEKAMANIDAEMKKMQGAAGTYNTAADYYLNENMDSKKALEYSTKAVEMNGQAFWILKNHARAQAANGMYKEAMATAEKSKELALKADNMAYVKMNEENIAKWKTMK